MPRTMASCWFVHRSNRKSVALTLSHLPRINQMRVLEIRSTHRAASHQKHHQMMDFMGAVGDVKCKQYVLLVVSTLPGDLGGLWGEACCRCLTIEPQGKHRSLPCISSWKSPKSCSIVNVSDQQTTGPHLIDACIR